MRLKTRIKLFILRMKTRNDLSEQIYKQQESELLADEQAHEMFKGYGKIKYEEIEIEIDEY